MTQPGPNWDSWLKRPEFSDLVKSIELPDEVCHQPWNPQRADQLAAWELYTELRMRITTQPLSYLDGDEKIALESVAKLFAMARELIRKYGPESRHFTTLTTFVLNRIVRKFTAKWHKKAVEGKLNYEDDRHDFRSELQSLQKLLRQFATMLGALAENSEFALNSESWLDDKSQGTGRDSDLPFDILFDDDVPIAMQNEIRWREHDAIRIRRGLIPLPDPQTATSKVFPPFPIVPSPYGFKIQPERSF